MIGSQILTITSIIASSYLAPLSKIKCPRYIDLTLSLALKEIDKMHEKKKKRIIGVGPSCSTNLISYLCPCRLPFSFPIPTSYYYFFNLLPLPRRSSFYHWWGCALHWPHQPNSYIVCIVCHLSTCRTCRAHSVVLKNAESRHDTCRCVRCVCTWLQAFIVEVLIQTVESSSTI